MERRINSTTVTQELGRQQFFGWLPKDKIAEDRILGRGHAQSMHVVIGYSLVTGVV